MSILLTDRPIRDIGTPVLLFTCRKWGRPGRITKLPSAWVEFETRLQLTLRARVNFRKCYLAKVLGEMNEKSIPFNELACKQGQKKVALEKPPCKVALVARVAFLLKAVLAGRVVRLTSTSLLLNIMLEIELDVVPWVSLLISVNMGMVRVPHTCAGHRQDRLKREE